MSWLSEGFDDSVDYVTGRGGGGIFGGFMDDAADFFSDDVWNDPGAGGALPYAIGAAAGAVTGGLGAGGLITTAAGGALGVSAGAAGAGLGAIIGGAMAPTVANLFDVDQNVAAQAEDLIGQGVDEATAVQQAALERALNFLNPNREAGLKALPKLEGLAGLYGQTAEDLHPLLAEEVMSEGLSPLAQLNLKTSHESIDKALGSIGQYRSGLRVEEYGKAGERISAQDAADKWNKRLQMAGLGQSQVAGLVDAGMGMSSQSAGLTVGTGANIGMTQLGGALGRANIEAQKDDGIFGRDTQDYFDLARIGIGIAGL